MFGTCRMYDVVVSDLNGLLDSEGCMCITAGGVKNIVKGTRLVMKDEMVRKLYKSIRDIIPSGEMFE